MTPLKEYSEMKTKITVNSNENKIISHRKPKTSTRKQNSKLRVKKTKNFKNNLTSTSSANMIEKNQLKINKPDKIPTENEEEYANLNLIQTKSDPSSFDVNNVQSDVSKWADWRTRLNENLINNDTSLASNSTDLMKQTKQNESFAVAKYLKDGSDKDNFTLFGLPKVQLSKDVSNQINSTKNKIQEPENIPVNKIAREIQSSLITEKSGRKIPGVNVREKIKAFEQAASSSASISSKSKVSGSIKQTVSTSSFSTTTTSLNRDLTTKSIEQKISPASKTQAKNNTIDDSNNHIYYNDDNRFNFAKKIILKPKRKISKPK